MSLISVLGNIIDAIDEAGSFPFGADLEEARRITALAPDELIARHLRTLVEGCRAIPGFPFRSDLDEAERQLERAAARMSFEP